MQKEDRRIRVIISTFYEGQAIKAAITKLSPDKLILLMDEPSDINKKEDMRNKLNALKDFFKDTGMTIETIKITPYDIPKIMTEVVKKIDEEAKKDNEIIAHITEGRKITSLALLFAAYMKKDKVLGAYYITEEKHELIKLPLLDFKLNETKKALLQKIAKNNINPDELMKKLDIKQSAYYKNIQELKKEGYLENNKELKLTDLGRIMIL